MPSHLTVPHGSSQWRPSPRRVRSNTPDPGSNISDRSSPGGGGFCHHCLAPTDLHHSIVSPSSASCSKRWYRHVEPRHHRIQTHSTGLHFEVIQSSSSESSRVTGIISRQYVITRPTTLKQISLVDLRASDVALVQLLRPGQSGQLISRATATFEVSDVSTFAPLIIVQAQSHLAFGSCCPLIRPCPDWMTIMRPCTSLVSACAGCCFRSRGSRRPARRVATIVDENINGVRVVSVRQKKRGEPSRRRADAWRGLREGRPIRGKWSPWSRTSQVGSHSSCLRRLDGL